MSSELIHDPLTEASNEVLEAAQKFAFLRSRAGGAFRTLVAGAGVVCAAAALAPAGALADYNPLGQQKLKGALGEHRVAVVPVSFSDGEATPFTPEQLDAAIFTSPDSVSNYYATASFGQLHLEGDVLNTVEVPPLLARQCNDEGFLKVSNAANAEVEKAVGKEFLDAYDNYLYVIPRQTNCINPNNGQVLNGGTQGNTAVINAAPGMPLEGVSVHELGHQFGLSHANVVHCYDAQGKRIPTPLGFNPKCKGVIYQDPFDPMGTGRLLPGSPVDFDGLNKARLGWLKPANIKTVTRSTDLVLAPDETTSDAPQLALIPYGRIDGKQHYVYLDYRQPVGEDAKIAAGTQLAGMFSGVTVRESGPIGRDQPITLGDYSNLVDTQPGTMTAVDATLDPGQTYRDHKTGIIIKTLAANSAGARVSIKIPQ